LINGRTEVDGQARPAAALQALVGASPVPALPVTRPISRRCATPESVDER
jgi:hypothetical protein